MGFAQSLKDLLFHELKIKRILTVDEVIQIATDHGYKASNAERRLRRETSDDAQPIARLDIHGKPIKGSRRIRYYGWLGAQTSFKPEKFKRQKRSLTLIKNYV